MSSWVTTYGWWEPEQKAQRVGMGWIRQGGEGNPVGKSPFPEAKDRFADGMLTGMRALTCLVLLG